MRHPFARNFEPDGADFRAPMSKVSGAMKKKAASAGRIPMSPKALVVSGPEAIIRQQIPANSAEPAAIAQAADSALLVG